MKQNGYVKAVKAAFPYTIPVLTGYLFIGIAFGVMYQEKGYNFLWAILMSILVYAGSGQYLAVNFFAPGVSFLQIIFLEFMVNIRHVFYGLSLIEKFRDMGKKKLYMIFSLTDETYSLFFITKVPEGVDEHKFLFSIALLDQLYWIIGSAIGAIAAKRHFSAVSGGTSNFKQSSFFVLFIKCSHTFLFCAGIIQNISAGKRFPQISNANALLSQCFQQRQRQASQCIDFFLLCGPAFAERVAYATLFYQLLHIRSICLTKIPDCECQILRCHLRR